MFPDFAPFTPSQRDALTSVITSLDANQRLWLSGFLAAGNTAAPAANLPAAKLLILYGTESGNCETLADRAAKLAKKQGFQPSVKNMSETSPSDLAKFDRALIIVSTWGDGEPPEAATKFYQAFLASTEKLPNLQYAICALGDTSYEKFCQTGKDIDAKLQSLGAKPITPRQDCDVDYEDAFTQWLSAALTALAPAQTTAPVSLASFATSSAAIEYSKKNPFPSEVLEHALLNGEGSSKETIHLALNLQGSGLSYEPGDALAVKALNADDTINELLQAAKLNGDELVTLKDSGQKSLRSALREDLDITAISRAVLTKLQGISPSPELEALLADNAKETLKNWLHGRQIVDALEAFTPNGIPADQLVSICRKLPPRLYSIASSPLAHPGEVHLTVGAVRYQAHGRQRKGVCSTYIADILHEGEKTQIFIQPNKHFRLPENPQTPIIMVGPGTGIAPFRAFIEHRSEQENRGKSWLFFGDQHYLYDFLYQLEWQDHLKSGALTKLDVAFSRDQREKIYVQDKLRQRAAEVFTWLEQGAHFYVCGDASRMANDVHQTLLAIIQEHGKLTPEQAEAYVDNLKTTKRYQRDVY